MKEIFNKNYHEISESEKKEHKDLFSNEEEFMQVKFVLQTINKVKLKDEKHDLDSNIKSKLDVLFHEKNKENKIVWLNSFTSILYTDEKKWYQQNFLKIAAILLLIITFLTKFNSPFKQKDTLAILKTDKIEKNQNINDLEKTVNEDELNKEKSNTEPKLKSDNEPISQNEYLKIEPVPTVQEIEINETSNVKEAENSMFLSSAPPVIHPDGVFIEKSVTGSNDEANIKQVYSLKNNKKILDLIVTSW